MKSLKTPLRYPGGKSRAVSKLFQFLPEHITEFREPFLGGGNFAIAMTKQFPDYLSGSTIVMNLFIISGYNYNRMEKS